jgi:hypothetical protein
MSGRSTPADEPAKDVLAAEAFAVPGADPNLHHRGPIKPPQDPSGIAEPHDVLAAEEFPMPAGPRSRASTALMRRAEAGRRSPVALALGLLGFVLVRRRRRG